MLLVYHSCYKCIYCVELVLKFIALLKTWCYWCINVFYCKALNLFFLHLSLNIFQHNWWCSFIWFCSINSCNISFRRIWFNQTWVKRRLGICSLQLGIFVILDKWDEKKTRLLIKYDIFQSKTLRDQSINSDDQL